MVAYFPMAEGAAYSNWSLLCEEKQGQTTRRRRKRERERAEYFKSVGEDVFFFSTHTMKTVLKVTLFMSF